MATEPWRLTATELSAAVVAGEMSASEIMRAHLDRIAEVNVSVNAVTNVLAEQAEQSAAEVDRRRAAGDAVGSLAGVPFTVKENIDVAGAPTTYGVPKFRDMVAETDAPPVQRLRAAGAIPIGHSNMPDMTLGAGAMSTLFGRTHNPWDLTKTPGGSSCGDAAAVAAGMAPIGLGNDSGGSIVMPANFCGDAGLKPSHGRFPIEHRIGSKEPTLASQLFPVDGPIARSVADLRAAYEVLAGTDPRDPRAVAVPLDGPPPPAPIRIGVTTDPGGLGVHPDVRAEVEKAAGLLQDAGYAVEEVELPRLADALAAYGKMITAEFGTTWTRIRPLLTEDSARHMETVLQQQPSVSLEEYLQATADRHGIARDWRQFFARYPLVLGPVFTDSLAELNAAAEAKDPDEQLRFMVAMRLCTATAFVGVPAVAVPTGVSAGLPTGVQIIGGHYREDLCLAAAAVIEERLGVLTPIDP